jgi:predicted ATPase/DNA-binding CsgD family transcriptional regulator
MPLGTMHGFPVALTSFVGRAGEVEAVAGLLAGSRLVTVTGPGGVGKTRLACEVTRRAAGRFADGAWLVELAMVSDPALVEATVAVALGLRQAAGMSVLDALAAVLARRQLLLVLDNCEHLITAVAGLCDALLPTADDLRILATSREPVGVPGESRYRLPPLTLPAPGDREAIAGSEAITLFADRARQADPRFTLGPETAQAVARLVRGLDGVPLAIEMAAARVEALGVTGLADRFALLAGGNRLAADRHQSLAATARWSYELLTEQQRQVFRKLAVFPGPFTLEAAEAVAGTDAGLPVLHLVDCSLLSPPRTGPDGRTRYLMLDTLRAYGAERLAEAGEERAARTALARFAVGLAEEAAAGLQTIAEEAGAARWLDGEDATMHHALAWGLERDPPTAVRLAVALAPWWFLRGRWAPGYELLSAATAHAPEGGQPWCTAQFWLGLLTAGSDVPASLGHLTAVRDALAGQPPEPLLARALAWRAGCLANLGRVAEAAGAASRALTMARELGDPTGEAFALYWLGAAAGYGGDHQQETAYFRQAQRIDRAAIPGWIARQITVHLAEALHGAGEAADAQRYCTEALALALQAGALYEQGDCLCIMARLDLHAGQLATASAHLREALEIYAGTSASLLLLNCLEVCGPLCAATRGWRELITVSAAWDAVNQATFKRPGSLPTLAGYRELLQKATYTLSPEQVRTAHERGAAMTPAAAAEFALLLLTEGADQPATGPGLAQLSPRERELVTLVAQGRTDAQIAGQLFITVRTVRSHLDRIRDKTGCRRRADLTRFALQASLV